MILPPSMFVFYGPNGTVKTSNAISAEGTVHLWDFDAGAHRAKDFNKLVASSKLIIHTPDMATRSITTRHERLKGFSEAYLSFVQDFVKVCEMAGDITMVVDTGTVLWKIIQDAYLQELQRDNPNRKQLIQIEFGEPNSRMRSIWSMPKMYGKNLIAIFHETDEYATVMYQGQPVLDDQNKPQSATTGIKIPEGFKSSRNMADWVFTTTTSKNGEGRLTPHIQIEKSGLGLDLVDEDIEDFSFDKFINFLKMHKKI